jgi:tetratricopeptide (TPR) repeat protein
MDKDKQLISIEGEQTLLRVNVQIGLMNKILEEDERKRKNAWFLLLNTLFKAQSFEDLLNQSEQCVLEFPIWYLGYFRRGCAKDNLNSAEAAILDYDKAIGLNPNATNIYWYRGKAKYSLGDYEGGRKDVDVHIDSEIYIEENYY